jgi:hypothetical protein
MYRKFVASRISRDNAVFPPQIILADDCVIVKCPGLFSGTTTSIPYDSISHMEVTTPLIGFSTISFYAYGEEISIHGFTKSEANQINRTIIQKKEEQ